MNRELSWLKFNERVLEEAESERVPLCERLTFASIYQSNLDEFFMVRVGSLADQMLLSKSLRDSKTHMTAEEQIRAILKDVARLNRRKDAVYAALMGRLEDCGIRLVNFQKLGSQESGELERYFDGEIAPLLSPTMVSRRQPFPFLQNKEIYAVGVLTGKSGREKLGIIPCGTGVIPRLIAVPGQPGAYMLSEELILHFLPKVFGGHRVVSKSLLRLTRNADIDADALYDEDLDYREFMAKLIKRRRRLAPVRLDLSRELDGDIVKTLCAYTEVRPESVFRCRSPLDLSFLFQIQDALRQRPELFYEKRFPQRSSMLRYRIHADNGSMYNTPPAYGIYICGKVFRWLKERGGLEAMRDYNVKKAAVLYDFLDESRLFRGTVEKKDRSLMNVPFVTGDLELDGKFVREAERAGLVNLKGHRSVGGMRASIYNAMPIEGVEKLVAFMKDFEQREG